ncbi:protein involved in polysaccharide export, contains SLBB domain of the beta-grasp fold [Mucilaginibacter pineti]|uniref:Protein involved in polysaccharide export, contains SLBB domain of the beta-grasp fold n=1 Tax=Mucilaginibacter pineti TaxID=1391627 RepID=A0A1G6YZL3_9SPHI|nr:SLBB domain-containing protein [Mucilaginibacter pineti]SDD95790.1 protein involved in polysaccharide export, contains SLBB domain of the beta-grasp fold [Mucilaginibacter pineti]
MNKINFPIFFFIVFVIFFSAIDKVSAQNSLQNISTINVDDISDQQVIQLLQQAQKAGISDDELISQARSRGMTGAQAQKLQVHIRQIRTKSGTVVRIDDTTAADVRKLNYKQDSLDGELVKKDLFESLEPRIFGAEIFKNKNSSFEPNLKLATPVNYIVGPNDQLNINVYGSSLVNWKLEVSPEGNINIPGVGILNVASKTIEQATSAIKGKLAANNYAIGHGTTVQVTLGNIRSIQVIMIGQVTKPGTYTLSSLATVFNALYMAGGPNVNGSLREIEIIRNNRIIRHLDVYDFLLKGDQKNNISLQDQDIVRVPTYRTRVQLVGEVKIPALFEVLPGETLDNLINYAGGFTDSAYTARIKVSQVSDQQRKITDVVEADYKSYIPLRGDKYTVESIISRYQNRVVINGAVFRPGDYELQNGLTLNQLIEKAAGLKEDAFTDRGTITRLKPDNTTEIIAFNVKDVINKVVNISLQREDIVNISSIFDLRDKYVVTINGSVRKPGQFAFAENLKVEDLILKAGGFADGASTKRIEVARRTFDADPASKSSSVAQVFNVNIDGALKPNDASFVLSPFDIVSVYSLPGYEKQKTVKVEGEVLYPGSYTIKNKNEKISDLIARAGGLTASADVEGGSLKRENIAILGIDKDKSDTVALETERISQAERLKRTYKDSTTNGEIQQRNNYVGIDLGTILKSPGTKTDLLLENGDILRVPKQQQIVRVNGQVLYPSAVVYERSKSFNDFVSNAGGYSPGALKRGAYVVYPNGTVKGTRKFLFFNSHPAVKPGSEIYVPKKPERKGNSVQTILGLSTGLASLGAIILGILSLNK